MSEETAWSKRPTRPANGWFGLQRLYRWVERRADSPRAGWWLAGIAFAESSFFPIPPDALLVPLAASRPRRALRWALVCTLASVLGAALGWAIGYGLYDALGRPILELYGLTGRAEQVLAMYRDNAVGAILVAGFTPIPYKAFTILAGMNGTVSLPLLLGVSLLGRGARFFLVGGLIRLVGPAVQPWVERHFDRLALAAGLLLVLGFLAVKVWFR